MFPTKAAGREGYLAGRRGRADADNPYKGETREACAWLMGMHDDSAKRLKIIATGKRQCD
jgi:ribosome modulation factor